MVGIAEGDELGGAVASAWPNSWRIGAWISPSVRDGSTQVGTGGGGWPRELPRPRVVLGGIGNGVPRPRGAGGGAPRPRVVERLVFGIEQVG